MHKEQRKQIRDRVYQYVAPAHNGLVRLADVYRLYSHIGTAEEIEKCLDELVKKGGKDGNVKKMIIEGEKTYLFVDIATRTKTELDRKLEKLEQKYAILKSQEAAFEAKLNGLFEMRKVWLDGWRNLIQDSRTYVALTNFISSVFFQQRLDQTSRQIEENGKASILIAEQIKSLETEVNYSYKIQT